MTPRSPMTDPQRSGRGSGQGSSPGAGQGLGQEARGPRRCASGDPLLIAIDGPAGAGKTTLARRLADHFGLVLLDTGAIYRTLAWVAREAGVEWSDEAKLAQLATHLPIAFHRSENGDQRVFCRGVDISAEIRDPEISEGASQVSVFPLVRARLLALQQRLAADGCVAEGRDMGTVVFPRATVKLFLTAAARRRAERRQRELALRFGSGQAPAVEQVEAELCLRDARDAQRSAAPLVRADDAVLLDSSDLDEEGVFAQALAHVERACAQANPQR